MWLEISKELIHNIDKNLKICVIYNPPKNSRYYNPCLVEDEDN